MQINNLTATYGSFTSPVTNSTANTCINDEEDLFTVRTANSWLQSANQRAISALSEVSDFGRLCK